MAPLRIRKPLLTPGGSIGVIALSSPCKRENFELGLQQLRERHPALEVPLDPCAEYGTAKFLFSSASAAARAAALMQLVDSHVVEVLISVRGGYGSAEVLPQLDLQKIADSQKVFCGFSDSTTLLNQLVGHGAVAIHGPSVESFSSLSPERKQSAKALLDLLLGAEDQPLASQPLVSLTGGNEARGAIIGGNLSVLCSLIGTPWEVSAREKILFLEEVGEKPHRVHRNLLQLKQSGALSGVRGILLGQFKDCDHAKGDAPAIREVLLDIFKDVGVPVLSGLPCGHDQVNLPLPLGVPARMSTDGVTFEW